MQMRILYIKFGCPLSRLSMNNIKMYSALIALDYVRKYLTLHSMHTTPFFNERPNSTRTEYNNSGSAYSIYFMIYVLKDI